MKFIAKSLIARVFALLLALLLVQGGALAQDRPITSRQQLDQMLAPIALYPDALLSQILMASTYPLEVVEAARWSGSHPDLAGDDAVRTAENEDWDPSVKSLVAFPQVLARMNENLQWTQSLGDAFLSQEQQVMNTVQNLRHRAQEAGNLRSDDRVRIVDSGPVVIVEYANPQVVYVPYYDPMAVYGTWWWPDYRPVYWRPWPGYYSRPGFTFYWGTPIGISARFFFGGCDWSRRQVRVVQVNNYYYNNVIINRHSNDVSRGTTITNLNRTPGVWQHDPEHRRGVAYRTVQAQQQFGSANRSPDLSRRGRDEIRSGVAPDRSNGEVGPDRQQPGMQHSADLRANEHPDQRNDRHDAAPSLAPPAASPRATAAVSVDNHDFRNRGNRLGSQQMRGTETLPEKREPRSDFHGRQMDEHRETRTQSATTPASENQARASHPQSEGSVEAGKSSPGIPHAAQPQAPQAQIPHPQPEPSRRAAPHDEQHHRQPNVKENPAADK